MSGYRTETDERSGLEHVIEEIDARLREAERLRNYLDRRRSAGVWPDRRRVPRVPGEDWRD